MRLSVTLTLLRQAMALTFATVFFVLSVSLAGITVETMIRGMIGQLELTESFLKAINMAVIALATFELGLVVTKEYAGRDDAGHIAVVLQRTLPRFVSIVCIALVLEGLLMVIKYSQLELAGNLYYPVAIIFSAAFLLAALGIFVRLSASAVALPVTESPPIAATATSPAPAVAPATA